MEFTWINRMPHIRDCCERWNATEDQEDQGCEVLMGENDQWNPKGVSTNSGHVCNLYQ